MENIVLDTPNLQQPEVVPVKEASVGLDAIAAKMAAMRNQVAATTQPGTGTSDSIPAMLSDGEFVITAKAVRGAGNGSRREGAKKLYRMMHALEKKAK